MPLVLSPDDAAIDGYFALGGDVGSVISLK
jgi:hypothetical protein